MTRASISSRGLIFALAFSCLSTLSAEEVELNGRAWMDMNYGPYLTASIEVGRKNIAHKGIAVRVDSGAGGVSKGRAFQVFDTDTLRGAGGWTGKGFINWRSIVFDGSHGTHPRIVGNRVYANAPGPGWARGDNDFEDVRVVGKDGVRYGPLSRDWAHWKGLYVHGDRVVLSYTVGGTKVLESPTSESEGDSLALVRNFDVGPRSKDLILRVAQEPRKPDSDDAGESVLVFVGAETKAPKAKRDAPKGTLVIGRVGADSAKWATDDDGIVTLSLPAGKDTLRFKLLFSRASGADRVKAATALMEKSQLHAPLASLTKGGPARFQDAIETEITTMGNADSAYVVESLGTPMKNAHRSWMRLGGFDFFKDPSRAAVCTWMGDVWIVEGADKAKGEKTTWRRIATGLYQPLGLKIVDEVVYVLGRDQITRLQDLNGDGEPDFYENFNNDAQATEHFHEFAMDLQTDADGNFYYMKGGRHAKDSVVPQHGSLLKVSKDGSKTEFIAYGFRAPNGLCVNGDGSFITSDQQGHWTPANRINWVQPGGFYGYMLAYHRGEKPKTYEKPLCWLDHDYDRSPAAQLWVKSKAWGPVSEQLLTLSYGTGDVGLVLHEKVGDVYQGGATKLPIATFPTGIMRGRFHPKDGQLYICGLFGWAGNRTRPGGFYRVRYTGKPLYVPTALHVTKSGVVVRFNTELDERRATRAGAYQIQRWNYKWAARYGSDDFKVSDGKKGRDKLNVKAVKLSKDKKAVLLELDDLRPAMQQRITLRLRAADGGRIDHSIFHSIHALGSGEGILNQFD